MPSRIRSDFGTLGERLVAMDTATTQSRPETNTPSLGWVLSDGDEQSLLSPWGPVNDGTREGLLARVGGIDDL
ncbi:hypothetical protein [Luteococcus sp.]|uniref:hypothetical protein n=1 Tax=Luteococcus sp. TaxID=1969402 RepID=UPI003736F5A1